MSLEDHATQFLSTRKDLGSVDVANTWKLLLTAEEISRGVEKCAKAIDEKFEGQEVVVVCILKGCAYFFVDVTRKLTIPYSTYFLEASSYHNAQTQSESVELLSILVPEKFAGKKVVLLDELYDNGFTLHNVRQKLVDELKLKEEDIFTCTLFQKPHKKQNFPLPTQDLVGMKIPNVWVVGYGLDDQQEKRGWPDLWACPKMAGIPADDDDELFEKREYYEKVRGDMLEQIPA